MEQQTKTSGRALGAALKPRQLTMMGLGSAIGAGLFIGSGAGIQAAGPAVLISYLVAGTLIILVMWALGEMAAANPDSGAFSVYTAKAYGPVAGATVGWLWWLQLVVVIAAEGARCGRPAGHHLPGAAGVADGLCVHRGAHRREPHQREELRRVRVLVRPAQGGSHRRDSSWWALPCSSAGCRACSRRA